MSFDFFPAEQAREMNRAAQRPSLAPEPGFWTGFAPGAASLTMEGFAKTARAIDLMGAVGPMVEDALTGGTDAQDRYFREHDEVFNRAVDYWTPRPGDVGTAGRVVGGLLPTIADFAISPGLAIAKAGLGTPEDLVREGGVSAGQAVGAGVIEATGLGLGAWLPFTAPGLLGKMAVGAGTNLVQGVATRAGERQVLKGTPAAERFNPWDGESVVLDILMGAGFGAIAHLGEKPAAKPGDKKPIIDLTPEQRDAVLTANQARHIEDTTAPGLPATALDRDAHVAAMAKAVDDVLNGRPAEVDRLLQDAKFLPDEARMAAHEEVRQQVGIEARRIILEETARSARAESAEATPGFLRSAEDLVALKGKDAPPRELAAEVRRAIEIAKKPGFQRTADEKRLLDAFMNGRGGELLLQPVEPPAGPPLPKADPAAEGSPAKGEVAKPAAPPDALVQEAQAHLAQRPDLALTDESGTTVKLADQLARTADDVASAKGAAGVFRTAAACFLGMI